MRRRIFLFIPALFYFGTLSAQTTTEVRSNNLIIRINEEYPDEFTLSALTEHIDDLLSRFQNKALGDTIFRVGCDLKRKLAPEDRLAGAVHLAIKSKQPYDKILFVLICACHFNANGENGKPFPGDVEFQQVYNEGGLRSILTTMCEFNESQDHQLILLAEKMEKDMKLQGIKELMKKLL